MMDASICGLGQAAPNPMNSVIRYFPKETSSKTFSKVKKVPESGGVSK